MSYYSTRIQFHITYSCILYLSLVEAIDAINRINPNRLSKYFLLDNEQKNWN